jgi:hypothetical protein
MPAVAEVQVPDLPDLGIALEGRPSAWPSSDWPPRPLVLPPLSPYGVPSRWIEVFNRGGSPFKFSAISDAPWLRVHPANGLLEKDQRLVVSVDWASVPNHATQAKLAISGAGRKFSVTVPLDRRIATPPANAFIEDDGVIAIEAEHYQRAVTAPGLEWRTLAGHGRTLSGVTISPVTAPSQKLDAQSPHLEYDVVFASGGEIKVEAVLSPTLPFQPGRGLRFAISFDDAPPQTIEIRGDGGEGKAEWEKMVADSVRKIVTTHKVPGPGAHVLKFWLIDPAVVLQRLVVDCGGLRPSYFGPPESMRVKP